MGRDYAKYKLVICDTSEDENGNDNTDSENYLEILIYKCFDIDKRDNELYDKYRIYTIDEILDEFPFFDIEKYKQKYEGIHWCLKEIYGVY